MQQSLRLIAAIPVAAVGGWGASLAGIPLAWLIGSTVVTTAITLTIAELRVPKILYRSGQLVVGSAVGLTVSGDIASRIGLHIYVVPVAALVSLLLGRLSTPLLARLGGMDPTTAFFSLVPAGISEMAELAHRHGADAATVATLHALRVFLVVLVLPLLLFAFTDPGPAPSTASDGAWSPNLFAALATGLLAALAGMRLGMPSAFMIAPMIVVSILSGTETISAKEPAVLLALAQILLGCSLGSRFHRQAVLRLPRAMAAGTAVLTLNAAAMALLATVAASFLDAELPLMLLAFATGGTAELVLTARVIGADAALVAVYQVMRGLCGNLLAGLVYKKTVARPGGTPNPD